MPIAPSLQHMSHTNLLEASQHYTQPDAQPPIHAPAHLHTLSPTHAYGGRESMWQACKR